MANGSDKQITGSKHSKLLNAAAYNPRSKKTGRRRKPYDRRQVLDLEDDDPAELHCAVDNDYGHEHPTTNKCHSYQRKTSYEPETKSSSVATDSATTSTDCASTPRDTMVKHQKTPEDLKTIRDFLKLQRRQELREPKLVRPYGSKTFVPRDIDVDSRMTSRDSGPAPPIVNMASANTECVANSSLGSKQNLVDAQAHIKDQTNCVNMTYCHQMSAAPGFANTRTVSTVPPAVEKNIPITPQASNQARANTQTAAQPESQAQPPGCSKPVDKDRLQYLEKYRKAIESGWIKTAGGEWTRDPNVEFDSDDEQPDV